MNNTLQQLKQTICESLFGISLDSAHELGICVSCKLDALNENSTEANFREYEISGLCSKCLYKILTAD